MHVETNVLMSLVVSIIVILVILVIIVRLENIAFVHKCLLTLCIVDDLFSTKLKDLGPSTIDAEFRCLAPGAGGDIILMENFMKFLISQLQLPKDFELTQGYMALFLKVCHKCTSYSI